MKPTYIFPIVMIVMNVGAAVMCVNGYLTDMFGNPIIVRYDELKKKG